MDDAVRALSPSTLSAVAGITSLIASVKALTGFMKDAIGNFSHFESMQMGLETFFQDADKGKEKFEQLRKLSNETTFGVDELTDAFTQLANVGVNVDSIEGELTTLGNLASGNKTKFAELVSIYSKIQSTGKAGAMQLQQIAMRGIPIYDILKKIGVQGTATAEDITKAFKMMTEEGGQFYNAMENINKTIEGKEGFISDYFKEFTVNFAEISGIADSYKKILDVLKEAIGAVSDKLLEWNQNPISKALFQGTMVAVLGGLVTVISVGLVGAITRLNAKLKETVVLKAILDPKTLALAVGVGLIAGLNVFVASYKKNVAQAEEETKKLADAVEDAKKKMGTNYNLQSVGVDPTANANKSKANASNTLELYKKNLAGFNEKLEESKKAVAEIEEKMRADGGGLTGYEARLKSAKAEVDHWREAIAHTNTSIEEQTRLLNYWEGQVKKLDIDTLAKSFEDIYNGTLSKEENQIAQLESDLATVLAYEEKLKELNGQNDANGKLIDYNKSKPVIDQTVEYLQNQLDNLKLNLKLAGMEDWQKDLQKLYGFDNKEVEKLLDDKAKGNEWVEKGLEKRLQQRELVNKSNKALGINQSDNAQKNEAKEWLKSLVADANKLMETGRFGAVGKDGKLDNSFIKLQTEINKSVTELDKLGVSSDEVAEILGNTAEKTGEFSGGLQKWIEDLQNSDSIGAQAGGIGMSALASASGDFSNFMQGMSQGGWIMGIINMLIGALANVASSCENFERAMNPITTAFRKLKPLLQVFIDIGADFTSGLEMILDILKPVIEILGFFARILRAVGTVVNLLLYGLKNLVGAIVNALSWLGISFDFASINESFDQWFEDMDDYMEIEKDKADAEKDQLRAIQQQVEAYQSLLSAMKENEEWYIRTKTALNANTRKEGFQSVNDMILTPQGNFSTDPNDYIIATKNPNNLGNGAVVNVNIQNNASSDVEVTATPITRNGVQEIMVQISRKIADDVANGANGWDKALARQQVRGLGRSLSL